MIVGARSVQRLDDNLAALSLRLTAEELAGLDELSSPEWGPYAFIGGPEPW